MENKQTAVEWLWEQIDELVPYEGISVSQRFNGLLEQAIAMEKEQIEDAWNNGGLYISYFDDYEKQRDKDFKFDSKEYYNETYGGKS